MASTLPTPSDCCSLCDGVTVTIDTGSGTINAGSGEVYVRDTLADLRAIASTSSTNRVAALMGNAAKYDMAPVLYTWDATSLEADNPFIVVRPNDKAAGDAGRWIQSIT